MKSNTLSYNTRTEIEPIVISPPGRFGNKIHRPVSLLKDFIHSMLSRLFLRRCRSLGREVTIRGRPRIEGAGSVDLADRVKIWSHLTPTQLSAGPGAVLEIGSNTFINTGTTISARRLVRIGQNCQIANQVIIMDSDFHGVSDRHTVPAPEAVIIEDDVWLATRSTVLKGVRIGKGAVVGAGAVVTKDVPPYTLVGGIPARVIKYLEKQS